VVGGGVFWFANRGFGAGGGGGAPNKPTPKKKTRLCMQSRFLCFI
jgi:hypothetical protein